MNSAANLHNMQIRSLPPVDFCGTFSIYHLGDHNESYCGGISSVAISGGLPLQFRYIDWTITVFHVAKLI